MKFIVEIDAVVYPGDTPASQKDVEHVIRYALNEGVVHEGADRDVTFNEVNITAVES